MSSIRSSDTKAPRKRWQSPVQIHCPVSGNISQIKDLYLQTSTNAKTNRQGADLSGWKWIRRDQRTSPLHTDPYRHALNQPPATHAHNKTKNKKKKTPGKERSISRQTGYGLVCFDGEGKREIRDNTVRGKSSLFFFFLSEGVIYIYICIWIKQKHPNRVTQPPSSSMRLFTVPTPTTSWMR